MRDPCCIIGRSRTATHSDVKGRRHERENLWGRRSRRWGGRPGRRMAPPASGLPAPRRRGALPRRPRQRQFPRKRQDHPQYVRDAGVCDVDAVTCTPRSGRGWSGTPARRWSTEAMSSSSVPITPRSAATRRLFGPPVPTWSALLRRWPGIGFPLSASRTMRRSFTTGPAESSPPARPFRPCTGWWRAVELTCWRTPACWRSTAAVRQSGSCRSAASCTRTAW